MKLVRVKASGTLCWAVESLYPPTWRLTPVHEQGPVFERVPADGFEEAPWLQYEGFPVQVMVKDPEKDQCLVRCQNGLWVVAVTSQLKMVPTRIAILDNRAHIDVTPWDKIEPGLLLDVNGVERYVDKITDFTGQPLLGVDSLFIVERECLK